MLAALLAKAIQGILLIRNLLYLWSWREESNPRPADYKSAALPTELRQHLYFAQLVILIKHPTSCNSLAGGIPRLDVWILTLDCFQYTALVMQLIKIQPVGGVCCIAGLHNGFKPVFVKHLEAYIHP
jgi:hypothetical protein